jgi:hypothetical protein
MTCPSIDKKEMREHFMQKFLQLAVQIVVSYNGMSQCGGSLCCEMNI